MKISGTPAARLVLWTERPLGIEALATVERSIDGFLLCGGAPGSYAFDAARKYEFAAVSTDRALAIARAIVSDHSITGAQVVTGPPDPVTFGPRLLR